MLGKVLSADKAQIRETVSSFRYKPRFPVAKDNGSTLWAELSIINNDKSVAKTFYWGNKIEGFWQ